MFKDSHRYANPTDMSMGIIRHLPKKEKRKMEELELEIVATVCHGKEHKVRV